MGTQGADEDDAITPTTTTPPSSLPPAVSLQATLVPSTAVVTSVAATTAGDDSTTSTSTAAVASTSSEAPAASDGQLSFLNLSLSFHFNQFNVSLQPIHSSESLQLEGVDPSFLAALPENIRLEVITEQLYLQRARSHAHQAQQQQVFDVIFCCSFMLWHFSESRNIM